MNQTKERDIMALPEGKTCADCAHLRRCLGIGYTSSAENKVCDFYPIRFVRRREQPSEAPHV
jgi:hypothetical protein